MPQTSSGLLLYSRLSSVLALAFVLFALPCAAQQPKVLAPHKPVPPVISPPQPSHKPAVPRSLLGGLWMTDASMKSYLHITNDLVTSSLAVTPIIWLSNGTKLTLPPINLEPSGTAVININQALADQGLAPYATLSGYVELDYQWPWDALCATVRNVDFVHSVIFASGLQLTSPSIHAAQTTTQATQQVLESLWWKQEANVTGFVALTNPGAEAVPASLLVIDSQGNSISQGSVTVSPHGTKIIDLAGLPQIAGASGGLRVQYVGQPSDLLVFGGLRDDAIGYSASIGFAPLPSAGTQTSPASYAALGLMTGAADPMLSFPKGTMFVPYTVARNISGQPILITPNLWWMAGGAAKIAALPQFTLAPGQSKNLDFSSLLAFAGLRNYNGTVNLVLDLPAGSPKGALLLSSGSVDQKNTYVFQVVPQGIRESIAKNLSYWSTANGDDTMVTLWNPADEPQDFVFTLFYTGGHYLYPIHLEPRATHMFNISEILHSSLPDAEGNVIPGGIHEGSAELSGSQGESEHILVAMDAGTYNAQKATCSTYCKTCQGAVNSWVTDNPFAVAVSGTHQLTFTVQNHSGTQVNDTSSAYWRSSNPPAATVSDGMVTAVAAGSLQAVSSDDGYPVYSTSCFPQGVTEDCPFQTGTSGSAPGNVQKPGFLQVVSTTTGPACTNGLGCIREMFYRVLDTNQGAMNIPGMNVAETLTTPTGCSGVSVTDAGVWTTDATGTLTGPDNVLACNPTVTCTLVYKQTFTVNGFPVQILSHDKLTAGLRNTISIAINNGVSACPVIAITP